MASSQVYDINEVSNLQQLDVDMDTSSSTFDMLGLPSYHSNELMTAHGNFDLNENLHGICYVPLVAEFQPSNNLEKICKLGSNYTSLSSFPH